MKELRKRRKEKSLIEKPNELVTETGISQNLSLDQPFHAWLSHYSVMRQEPMFFKNKFWNKGELA